MDRCLRAAGDESGLSAEHGSARAARRRRWQLVDSSGRPVETGRVRGDSENADRRALQNDCRSGRDDGRSRQDPGPDDTARAPRLRRLERPRYRRALDVDAARRCVVGDGLRQRRQSPAVALGEPAARIGRAPGARGRAIALVPTAPDRELADGAARGGGRCGAGIHAGAIDPLPLSDGARCQQCIRSSR